MELEDREKIVPDLRVQSRRIYLEKRKEDKVSELEADIRDDEYLFDDHVYVFINIQHFSMDALGNIK